MTGAQILIEQGRAEGRAELLLRQLRIKFGSVAGELEERIRDASVEELDCWAERVLSATSLVDVFDV